MKNKYKTLAVLYINDDKYNEGEKVLSVILKGNMKEGDKLYFRKNKFKTEEKHPDFVYTVIDKDFNDSVEESAPIKKSEDTWRKKDVDQDLPF